MKKSTNVTSPIKDVKASEESYFSKRISSNDWSNFLD
jgi:hypothetical protein